MQERKPLKREFKKFSEGTELTWKSHIALQDQVFWYVDKLHDDLRSLKSRLTDAVYDLAFGLVQCEDNNSRYLADFTHEDLYHHIGEILEECGISFGEQEWDVYMSDDEDEDGDNLSQLSKTLAEAQRKAEIVGNPDRYPDIESIKRG